MTQDKEFKKRIEAYRKQHHILIKEDEEEVNEQIYQFDANNIQNPSEKSQSDITEKTEKITMPDHFDNKNNQENLDNLTKNQKKNLKKKKLKKKKQAAKKAELEKNQENSENENYVNEPSTATPLQEEIKDKIKNKTGALQMEETSENMEKDLNTVKAKDSTKIHFDK